MWRLVFYGQCVTQVAIDVCKGSDVRPRQQQSWKTSESSAAGAAARLHKTKCKVKHNNTSILVLEGDITSYRCDVLVNAANADLQHIGGVALAICDAGETTSVLWLPTANAIIH